MSRKKAWDSVELPSELKKMGHCYAGVWFAFLQGVVQSRGFCKDHVHSSLLFVCLPFCRGSWQWDVPETQRLEDL